MGFGEKGEGSGSPSASKPLEPGTARVPFVVRTMQLLSKVPPPPP